MDNKGFRKQRDTSYSMTQKLLSKIGEKRLQELWVQYGMYKSAELLSVEIKEYVSSSTLRYLSQIKCWTRPINKRSPLYKGFLAGNVDPSHFKHLIFPKEEMNNGKRNNYKLFNKS